MPTIAWFYGIAIQMFYGDHNPPHLHARYAEPRRSFGYPTARLLPESCRRWHGDWFENGRWPVAELEENWRRAQAHEPLERRWPDPMPTNELPMVDVLRLRPLEGHRLWVRFTDGTEGVHDLTEVIARGGPMVEPLQDPSYFARGFVEMGAPTWPNGFDLDPINLYMALRDAGALTRTAAE